MRLFYLNYPSSKMASAGAVRPGYVNGNDYHWMGRLSSIMDCALLAWSPRSGKAAVSQCIKNRVLQSDMKATLDKRK